MSMTRNQIRAMKTADSLMLNIGHDGINVEAKKSILLKGRGGARSAWAVEESRVDATAPIDAISAFECNGVANGSKVVCRVELDTGREHIKTALAAMRTGDRVSVFLDIESDSVARPVPPGEHECDAYLLVARPPKKKAVGTLRSYMIASGQSILVDKVSGKTRTRK